MRFLIRIILGILLSSGLAYAETADGPSIMKQMKNMLEPGQSSLQRWTVSVTAEGDTVQWTVGRLYKSLKDGKGIVLVMLEPADVRGTAFLVKERENGPDLMWFYLPYVRRVRELLPVNAYEPFIGTDFTFADLGLVPPERNYMLKGEEDHSGVKAYKVEEYPDLDKFLYSRNVIWVEAARFVPLQKDYYDPAGQLVKTELFKDVSVVENALIPMRVEMKQKDGGSTIINVDKVDTKVEIPDELFDPKNLSKLHSHAIWQSLKQK